MGITFPPQSWVNAYHRLEARITRLFRPGQARNSPDLFTVWRHRFEAFVGRNFTGSPSVVPEPSHQTETIRLRPDPTRLREFQQNNRQVHFDRSLGERAPEPAAAAPVVLRFRDAKPEHTAAPEEQAVVAVSADIVESKPTKTDVSADPKVVQLLAPQMTKSSPDEVSPSTRRKRPAQLVKRAPIDFRSDKSLKEVHQAHPPSPPRVKASAPPTSDPTDATVRKNTKKHRRIRRGIAKKLGKNGTEKKQPTKSPAAGEARRRHKPVVRKPGTGDEKIDYWQLKKPKHGKELARHTELQKTGNQRPARSDLKDDAVHAFARDLDSLKGDRYLLGEGELAELASKAMQKGQQEQRELAWKLLQFQASDYPGEKELPEYFAIVAESDRETMTHAQANAACDLARAFLKQAYDFRDDGSKFRYDPTALAFLKETGELLSRGSRKANHRDRFKDVKNLYVDGLVTIPMEAAVKLLAKDPRYAKTAQLVNMLVQDLFNIDDRFPGFSNEARSVFQVFVQTLAGDVWPFLETMGASY